jgi:hypothetical protein
MKRLNVAKKQMAIAIMIAAEIKKVCMKAVKSRYVPFRQPKPRC